MVWPPAVAHKALPPRWGAPQCDGEAGDDDLLLWMGQRNPAPKGWLKHVETL